MVVRPCFKLRFRLLLLALLAIMQGRLPLSAQSPQEKLMGFVRDVETFSRMFPQEKVYLHLDNTGYFIGDTIWYKAYVVRPDTMAFTNLSRVLYVELVDPFGEILETQKLKIEDGQCHGDISLTKALVSGFYEIRAYTRYMTNWPSECIFSRVIPVFTKPEKEGDYAQPEIERAYAVVRTGSDIPDSLSRRERKRWMKEKLPIVSFYPEGGRLVAGLMSTIAFEVSLPDSVNIDIEGELQTEEGDVIANVRTLREGRGTFVCTPYGEPLFLCFNHGGKDYRYPLPTAEEEGCVMRVNALSPHNVGVQVTSSAGMDGKTLGITLMHNGRILAFETHTFSGYDTWNICYPRTELQAGVHQLTVFDTSGRIQAQRHFFIYGDESENVGAVFADSTIAPCCGMTLRMTGPRGSRVSLSVCDADMQTNDFRGNAATYLLLSSDLKGFVRDADYYLESDDNVHRQAADLLCLVQGWTRYDFRMMQSGKDFLWTQPIEDGLYLDGQLRPRLEFRGSAWMSRRARKVTRDVGGVKLTVRMYSETGEPMSGETVTDSLGHFVFNMPELSGEWLALFHTTKDGNERKHIISLNRLFQPLLRVLDYYECTLRPIQRYGFRFQHADTDYAVKTMGGDGGLWTAGRSHDLEEAVVEGKVPSYIRVKKDFIKRSHFRFDMQREADRYADMGKDIPTLEEWILDQPLFADLFYNKHRAIGYVGWGNYYDKSSSKALFTIEGHPENEYHTTYEAAKFPGVGPVVIAVKYGGDRCATGRTFSKQGWKMGPDHLDIDTFDDIYISLEENVTEYMFDYEVSYLKQYNPFHVLDDYSSTPKKRGWDGRKSVRSTYYMGYNIPHTFHMPNYSHMPSEADYRRTLYWNPDVRFNDNGEAIVEFYNNSTCKRISVSAEGISPTGIPIILKQHE